MAKLTEYKDMDAARQGGRRGHRGGPRHRSRPTSTMSGRRWRAIPAVMEQFAAEMKAAFAPGKLDPLTKELVYLAVSIANQCDYCIASHGTWRATRA